jgi:hypothetical protein
MNYALPQAIVTPSPPPLHIRAAGYLGVGPVEGVKRGMHGVTGYHSLNRAQTP